MINDKKKNYYIEKFNDYNSQLSAFDKRYNTISAVRAFVFVAAIILLIAGFKDNVFGAKVLGIILIILFVVLVVRHSKVAVLQKKMKSLVNVTDRYIKRFEEGWREFADDGSEFLQQKATLPLDIDLLGRASLYQMINVGHTTEGRRKLAKELCEPTELDAEELLARQGAVAELSTKNDFAIRFEAYSEQLAMNKKKIDMSQLIEACESKRKLPVWADIVRILFPVTEILLIFLSVTGVAGLGIPIVGFLIILAFSWLTKTLTDSVIAPFYMAGASIDGYREMMELIAKDNFESPRLSMIQKVYTDDDGVIAAIKKLANICQAFNIMYNPLIHQLLSGIVLWDYQIAAITIKWKNKYGDKLEQGFDGIYEMEFLSGLATISRIKDTCIPVVNYADNTNVTEQKNELTFEANGIYHPLISVDRAVVNDAHIRSGITIITGSNMSGKTTFLRTIATNLVLAYIGAPVCAVSLEADYMKLFTSMRVTDDVEHGISTFYAEILRIKAMAEYKDANAGNAPMLCLIDEIFKGTNSADRIVGAKEAITRLASDRCMVMVSTHDFELCTLSDKSGKEACNYHFEEYYEGDELKFDYKLKSGRCTTTNARAILKMAGF